MSVEEMDDAVGHLGVVGVVGHHDDGGAVLVEFGEQSHHLGPVLRVEVTRGLVGEDELGTEDHSAGDGYALLLSAGELVGKVLGTMADVHALHHLLHLLLALTLRNAEIGERQFDVLLYVELVDEVKALEDETYLAFADGRALVLVETRYLFVAKPVLARRGVVEESEDVEERGLATAGGTHDGDELAVLYFKRYLVERDGLDFFRTEGLA